jgi:hypothetical protein
MSLDSGDARAVRTLRQLPLNFAMRVPDAVLNGYRLQISGVRLATSHS